MPRHSDVRFRDFTPQADTGPALLGFANDKLDPETAPIAGNFYNVTVEDGPPVRLVMESGEPRTAAHRVFRLTLRAIPRTNGSFRPIGVEDVTRWQYLRNPLRSAERNAQQKLFEDLHAGCLQRVTENEVLLLTGLPPASFDMMGQDPHGPEIFLDAGTPGVRYVKAPAFLRWLDYVAEQFGKVRNGHGNGDGHDMPGGHARRGH